MFRKSLITLRRLYNEDLKKLLLYSGGVFLLCFIIGLAADILMPFNRWINFFRGAVLIPESLAIFVLGYTYGLYLHYKKINDFNTEKEWVPYRLRFSVKVRRQIAMVIGALIFVFIYATKFGPLYTFMSSVFLSMVIALIVFIRPTKQEQKREEYGIPDARDIKYKFEMDQRQMKRDAEKEAKNSRMTRMKKVLNNDTDKDKETNE